jgi:hypothetical protein
MATKPKPKRSNKPGTCLWCGKKLVYKTITTWERSQRPATPKEIERLKNSGRSNHNAYWNGDTLYVTVRKVKERTRLYNKPGAYGDGFFCTMGHAQLFAISAATTGFRFVPEA